MNESGMFGRCFVERGAGVWKPPPERCGGWNTPRRIPSLTEYVDTKIYEHGNAFLSPSRSPACHIGTLNQKLSFQKVKCKAATEDINTRAVFVLSYSCICIRFTWTGNNINIINSYSKLNQEWDLNYLSFVPIKYTNCTGSKRKTIWHQLPRDLYQKFTCKCHWWWLHPVNITGKDSLLILQVI